MGLFLGRKALKDERARQLVQRRNLARQTVRKYADDLAFGVGKDSRDTLRRINRQLRDHFLQRAEELTSSTSESLAAAQQAVRSSETARAEAAAGGGCTCSSSSAAVRKTMRGTPLAPASGPGRVHAAATMSAAGAAGTAVAAARPRCWVWSSTRPTPTGARPRRPSSTT